MKIKQIIESAGSTTSGAIATVASPIGKPQSRSGSLFKGKKTKKKFYEGEMKRIATDMDELSDAAFKKKYGKSKDEMRKGLREEEIIETDLILMPGQLKGKDKSFIPHEKDRRDHEVEMARSELYAAAKDAQRIYKMLQGRTEDEGLMGWQQSYITLASDYLNSVADSLEHHAATEGAGVIAGGMSNFEEEAVKEITDFKRKELERELAHEKNNYAVAIDGKVWKVFADEQQAKNIARSLQRKGKKATVHLAEAKRDQYTTRVDDEGNVVKVYPPSGPKTQKAYVKSLIKNLGSSHIGKRGESPRGDKVGKGANLKGSAVAKLSGGMSKVAEEKCPDCGGELVSEELMNEKKDACYYKVKSRYKVWPSAYASGALVKCRKKGAKNWGNKSK